VLLKKLKVIAGAVLQAASSLKSDYRGRIQALSSAEDNL